MEKERVGQFIQKLRKEKQMTQKDLAVKLYVTDKAVSKWERGLACPDISLLPAIADLLDVTISELLNGERSDDSSDKVEASVENALEYAEKAVRNGQKSLLDICAISFSAVLLLGIIVCVICNVAISGALTWSLFPMSACIFAWLIFFPMIKFGRKGIAGSLIMLSIAIVPFLLVLTNLVRGNGQIIHGASVLLNGRLDHVLKGNTLIMAVGLPMAVIGVAFLWCVYFIFKKWSRRKWLALAISFLVAIPAHIWINCVLSKIIDTPVFDIWDALSIFVIVILAVLFFGIDSTKKKGGTV